MYLFVDTLSSPNYLALFDEKRIIIDSTTWIGKQKEFDMLIEQIDCFLANNNLSYEKLSGIVAIIWPGGFTGTRITSLAINSINFSFNTPLFSLTVGDFFSLQNAPLPWISPLTKKEVIIWEENIAEKYKIIPIENIESTIVSSLTSVDFTDSKIRMMPANNYTSVIKNLSFHKKVKRIQPLYAKAPNITPQKTNASLWL